MSSLRPGRGEARRDLAALAFGSALLFLSFLGQRDLWNPNESLYGQAVVEMHATGTWLLPTVNGEVFAEKPILYYWLALGAAHALGAVDPFTLRLPSAVAGVASVLWVYLLVAPYAGRSRARLASVLFATTVGVFWGARSVQMDLLLTAASLAGLLAATRVLDHGLSAVRGAALAGVAAGIAALAKGPVGLLVILLPLATYAAATGRLAALARPAWLVGPLVAAAVAAPWHLALVAGGHDDALRELLWRQNVTRFVAAWDHQAPWWYYATRFFTELAPWALFVPLAWRLPDRDADEKRLDALAWCWILSLAAFFSLSASKRGAYLLPTAPAMAALAAGVGERWIHGVLAGARRRSARALVGALGVIAFASAILLHFRVLPERPALGEAGRGTALLLLAGGAAILVGLLRGRRAPLAAPAALLALFVAFYGWSAATLLPALDVYKSPRPFSDEVRRIVGDDAPLRSFHAWKWRAGYVHYVGRQIPRLTSLDALSEYWARPDRVFLIVERGELDEARRVIGPADPLSSRAVGDNQAFLFANR